MNARWYAASEWIVRAMLVNALWLAFTLLGGVVLGLAPATVAAHALARRYVRGIDGRPVRTFMDVYRAQLWRANVLLVPPVVGMLAALAGAVTMRGSTLPGAGPLSIPLFAAAAVLGLAVLYLPALTVHYQIPTRQSASRAFLFAVANLPSTAVLLLALAAVAYSCVRIPGLLVVVGVGGWICLSTALCLAFFAQNDAALSSATAPRLTHAGARL